MHLRSRVNQSVFISGADLHVTFQPDETIWTESSHKFNAGELALMAEQTGFRVETEWIDSAWPFIESLWTVH